jgi:predicted Fe-S protein YdhL (DUF1289 family)
MMMAVRTPCIAICQVDRARSICIGCGRTLAEIAAWGSASESWRDSVMAMLPARMRAQSSSLPHSGGDDVAAVPVANDFPGQTKI